MYARATKGVSLVPPAYYADIACERGRDYLSTIMRGAGNQSTASRNSLSDEEKEAVYQEALRLWGTGLHPNMHESMFYI